jgi:hypothetical protein
MPSENAFVSALAGFAPEPIATLFGALERHVVGVHKIWYTFEHLYERDENRALLNDFAPEFFRQMEYILVENLILRIARLLDPATSAKHKNCSLARLREDLASVIDFNARVLLGIVLHRTKTLAVPLLDLRHKVIAHSEYTRAVAPGDLLFPLRSDDVDAILAGLRDFMNTVTSVFQSTPAVLFEWIPAEGANELMAQLRLRSRGGLVASAVKGNGFL